MEDKKRRKASADCIWAADTEPHAGKLLKTVGCVMQFLRRSVMECRRLRECGGFLYLQRNWKTRRTGLGDDRRFGWEADFGRTACGALIRGRQQKKNSMLFEKGESSRCMNFITGTVRRTGQRFEMKSRSETKPPGREALAGSSLCRLSAFIFFGRAKAGRTVSLGQRQNGRKSKGRRHCEFGKVIKSAESDIGAGQKAAVGSEATMGQCGGTPGESPPAFLEDALIRIAALTGERGVLICRCADCI